MERGRRAWAGALFGLDYGEEEVVSWVKERLLKRARWRAFVRICGRRRGRWGGWLSDRVSVSFGEAHGLQSVGFGGGGREGGKGAFIFDSREERSSMFMLARPRQGRGMLLRC